MLSKYDLEQIIQALPDKDGVSTNPEVYQYWLEYQKQLPLDMFVGVIDDYTKNDKIH